jgi:hypothetical protein
MQVNMEGARCDSEWSPHRSMYTFTNALAERHLEARFDENAHLAGCEAESPEQQSNDSHVNEWSQANCLLTCLGSCTPPVRV